MSSPAGNQKIPRLWPFKRMFYGWGIVGTSIIISAAHVPMYGPVLSVFVKPIGDEMGWSRATISLAFAIGSLAGAFVSEPAGRVLDRYGARLVIVVSGLVIAAALLGLAAMREPWHLWLFFGVGRTAALAGINLGTTVAVSNWFVRYRGRAIAILAIGLRSGQALFPLFIAPVIIVASFRHAYVLLAVIVLALVVLPAAVFIRRRPEDMGLLPDGEDPGEALASTAAEPGSSPTSTGPRTRGREVSFTFQEARRTRALWLLIVATSTVFFAQTAVNLHAVANFQDRGIADSFAGVFVFIFAGVSAVSAVGWGLVMERIHVRWGTALAVVVSGFAMAVIAVADSLPMAIAFAVLFGLGTGGWTVAQTLIFADYFGRDHLGAIRGFAAAVSGPAGAAGPLLAGWLRDEQGDYVMAFTGFLGAMVIVFFALVFATPPQKPSAQQDGD